MNSESTKPKVWHCYNARSLRPLWTLEEMGVDYDVEILPFPPRYMAKEYLQKNVLGTIPYFECGDTAMTESSAICHFLVDHYAADELRIAPDHPDYGDYLNWLYHADATLTFPQTLVLRYGTFESDERKLPQIVDDYSKWFIERLRRLDDHIESREYLCGGRFTIADIAVGYALYLGRLLKLSANYSPQVADYVQRLIERPAFQTARVIGKPEKPAS